MGEVKHTPGPWEIYPAPIQSAQEAKDLICEQVDLTSPVGTVLYLLNAGGKCPVMTGCGPTSEANARLVSAAPDLLEALEGLLARVGCGSALHCEQCDAARAALRKARGESPDGEMGL